MTRRARAATRRLALLVGLVLPMSLAAATASADDGTSRITIQIAPGSEPYVGTSIGQADPGAFVGHVAAAINGGEFDLEDCDVRVADPATMLNGAASLKLSDCAGSTFTLTAQVDRADGGTPNAVLEFGGGTAGTDRAIAFCSVIFGWPWTIIDCWVVFW